MDPRNRELPPEELEQEVDEQQEEIEVPETEEKDPKPTVDLDEEEQNEKEFKQLDNKAFAKLRKEATEAKKALAEREARIQQYEARMSELQRQPAAPVYQTPPKQREYIGGVPVPQSDEEWNALARKDWKAAVDLRSIMKSREAVEHAKRVDTVARAQENSKQKTLAKHPELDDDNHVKTRIFLEILDRNPEYRNMSNGPWLAARDMEEEMEARGFSRDQIFGNGRAQNTRSMDPNRESRASLTGGGRTPEAKGRTVTLTKDELEFCKNNDLDPKAYAKEKLERDAQRKGAQL